MSISLHLVVAGAILAFFASPAQAAGPTAEDVLRYTHNCEAPTPLTRGDADMPLAKWANLGPGDKADISCAVIARFVVDLTGNDRVARAYGLTRCMETFIAPPPEGWNVSAWRVKIGTVPAFNVAETCLKVTPR